MASDSSRPGTSSGVTSITSAGGIRGIRAVASESWDDDFLWQHSSSSDLHLPSSTSRHHQRHSHYRDKRLSTASSSSEHYAPRTQVPYHAQARPHRKASSLSTSTMGSVFTQDEEPAPPLRTRLSRSTSSSHAQQDRRKNWASLSTTSLQEEEDEPTITLATIASRQTGTAIATLASSKTLKRPSTSPSPSSPSINSRPSKLVPPSPSFFRTVSSSSWRSTTPSLASDTYSATQTYESASATETDNETAEEGDKDTEDRTGNWEHLSLSPESQMLTASAEIALGQGSTSRRKRGRGNTFGATTPRLALSALFGSPTLPGNTTDKTENDTPPKRLGASLFRRSSRLKKMDTPSTKATPDIRDPTFGKVRSRSPIQPVSGQQTPVTSHRELSLPHGNNEEKTVRARQSTGASHHSTSTFLFLASPVTSETATHLSPGRPTPDLDRQTSFERTPKSSNATKGSSDYCHRYSGISYDSSLSDRLRFQVDEHEENTKEEHPLAGQKQDQEEALIHGRFNVGQDPPYENVQHLSPLSPSMVQQPDRSTTSLISNQSSATFTSTFSNDSNRAELARTASMPRRKLKKARPKTADSGLTAGKSFVTTAESDAETRLSNAASKSPSERASETLTPSFVFPAPSPRSIGETSEAPKAKVEATNNASGLTTWSTSSKKNGGIGSSLRRRVSRKRLGRVADESSADEGGYLTPARGSSAKTSTTGLSPNTAVTSQLLGSSSSLENSRSAFASRATIRQFSLVPTTGSQAHGQQSESLSAHDGNLETNHLPSASLGRSTHLLAGLSKRISRDFKINKSSSSAPKRTESVPFGKPDACGGDIPLLAAEETAVITSNAEVQVQPKDAGLQLDASFKKHRRPLSLSGFLSRSTGPLDSARSRSRSSTLTGSNGLSLLSHSVDSQILEHDIHIPAAPLSASAIGGFRRPSGFLHRSTASSGNIPTARVITESSGLTKGKRSSLDGSVRSPPILQHRRSFNPLWRSATTTVPEERPGSSLSLLSETSTVRPLSMLPSVPPAAVSLAQPEMDKGEVSTLIVDRPPTKLRQRHLPSLSLTLVPGGMISTPPKSAVPFFPVLSPRMMQRAHSEIPSSNSQSSSLRSYRFNPNCSQTLATSGSSLTSPANTPDSSSRRSDDSDDSRNIVRRVSLSDLKIPQRITNAQAKIGQDLKRVKEFKEGVDELKRLRKIYRGLLTSDKMPNILSSSYGPSSSMSDTAQDRPEASPSPPPIPADATARVDNLMARVAMDYQNWWEIADVLINLADGADDGQKEDDLPHRTATSRERCKSEIPVATTPVAKPNPDVGTLTPSETSTTTSFSTSPSRERDVTSENTGLSCGSSLSPTTQTHLSTPVQGRAPHLVRSHSTSSLSRQGHPPASPARLTGHNACVTISEDVAKDQHGKREHSACLSERQLQILRGMLDPHHVRRSPATPITSRSVDSSPARTPSITSISPRSHLFASGLIPLSPFTSRESNRPRSSSSAFSSISTSSPLRRRASVKQGHVILKTVETTQVEDGRLSVRGNSPIPDSPPFHVSNMLPTPISSPMSEYAPGLSHSQSRPSTSRSTSDKASNPTIDSVSSSREKSPLSSPILRKGRFRQASKAGMLGIRDFLKTFNNNRRNTQEGSAILRVEDPDDSEADVSITIATEEGCDSSLSVLENSRLDNEVEEKNPDSGPMNGEVQGETVNNRMQRADTAHCASSTGSSDEGEDWDKRSSDEEHSHLPRSDTQATVVPASLGLQFRRTIVHQASILNQGEKEVYRSRTQSAVSTTSVGTVVHNPSPQGTVPLAHDNENAGTAVQPGPSDVREPENIAPIAFNNKLALTSEAMPALLAKVMEVRRHCATCVTELRNVTV